MSGVLAAVTTLVLVALAGHVAGRAGVLHVEDRHALARIVFSVAMPALLFATVAGSDPRDLFSGVLIAHTAGLLAAALLYLVPSLLRRRGSEETVIGTLSVSYVNVGNLGIPLTGYVLGDVTVVAPVLLLQLLIMSPVAFLVLDGRRHGHSGWPPGWLAGMFRNPLIVATLLGLAVALWDVSVPEFVLHPVELIAGAAVPLALLAYGLSLGASGSALPPSVSPAHVAFVTMLKVVVHPLVAGLVGWGILGLEGTTLLAATLLAALPTAQNVHAVALRYGSAEPLARAAVLATTVAAVPVLVLASALLA